MKIAISGASGKTGYRVAEEALSKGYSVRLIVRKQSKLPDSLISCERINVSIFNSKELDDTLKGCDALVIATGARPSIDLTGPARIDACAVERQVDSCKRIGIKRIILVSSLCTGKFFHPLNFFGLILIWKRIGEKALEKSQLDWTIIRPGGLNEEESTIESQGILYSCENKQEEGSIPRRLVARCCVEALKTNSTIGRIIEVTSSPSLPRLPLNKAIESFSI
tara:strand:- start:480 stop:1148 length:669 start_codon:yes stop_codon:yes gene_type:complete